MAQGMASCGASIVIAGRNEAKAGPALASLRELGRECAFITADVTKKAACVKLVADTVAEFGRLDILVNNAGTSIRKMPQDYTEEEWHHVLDTNLTSAFLCSQAAYAPMKQQGAGKMINIGSMMSLFGAPYATPYASSKGGIVQMTRASGDRVGEGQHPGERGAARLDRHRPDEAGARAGARACTSGWRSARRPDVGACRPTWRGLRRSLPARHRIS